MTKKQPFCWKCASNIVQPNKDDSGFSLIGCKEEDKIKNYNDAEKMCPLFAEELEN